MPKRPTISDQTKAIASLDPATADGQQALRTALASTTGIVVAAAVQRVVDHAIDALVDELPPAFDRLCDIKRDPQCRGKIAIVRALHELDRWDDVFERGAAYRQLEPAYGKPVDTAAEIRGVCVIAHAHFVRPDAPDRIGEAFADPERTTRVAAAHACRDAAFVGASGILRLKILIGDEESEVLAACFEALLAVQREAALPFVLETMQKHDETGEVAAVALGASRLDATTELIAWCEGCVGEQRDRVGYLPLALSRREPATDYLVNIIRDKPPRDAVAAARALATFKHDENLRARVDDATRDRDRATRDAILAVM